MFKSCICCRSATSAMAEFLFLLYGSLYIRVCDCVVTPVTYCHLCYHSVTAVNIDNHRLLGLTVTFWVLFFLLYLFVMLV